MSAIPSSRLQGKFALVTASTQARLDPPRALLRSYAHAQPHSVVALQGIGLATALRLLQEGATVLISSRKQSSVDQALEYLRRQPHVDATRVAGVICHVGKREDIASLVASACRFSRSSRSIPASDSKLIDIVVSNAAVNPAAGPILETDTSVVDKVLDINLKSAIELVKEARPHLKSRASIVFVSSYTAYSPSPPIGMYAVSKTALLGLTRALAEELGGTEDRIRVNAVAPGIVPTKFSQALVANQEGREHFKALSMLKDLGKPEEIASVIAFLSSEDASYVTGESVLVAGGMVASRL